MKNVLIATSVMLLVGCAGNNQAAPADRPEIGGTWDLNEADSQNPLTLTGAGVGGFGTSGRAGGRPGGTRAGGRQAGGRSAGQESTARQKIAAAEQKLAVFSDMQKRLTISDRGATIDIAYAIGPLMTYRTTGKAPEDTVPVLGVVKRSAKWVDGQLIVKHKAGTLEMKEEFTRNVGSKRLFVYTTVKGLSRPLQYRRVYDPR